MTKRDINFRACIKTHNKFGKVLLIDWHTEEVMIEGMGYFSFDDVIFEQYTGLKDVNGVYIYEGDILSPLLDSNLKFVIEFKHGAFIGTSVNEDAVIKDASLRYLLVGKHSVIIGNVHENTELLD